MRVRGATSVLAGNEPLYVVDGVPMTDEYTEAFANPLDPRYVKSASVMTGGIPAEYGGKLAAVVDITSKSGLDDPRKASGEASLNVGRFGAIDGGATVGGMVAAVEGVITFDGTILAYGDTTHTFVNRDRYAGVFAPGYKVLDAERYDPTTRKPVGLAAIDHAFAVDQDAVPLEPRDLFAMLRQARVDLLEIGVGR